MARIEWRELARTALASDPNRRLLSVALAAAVMLLRPTPPEAPVPAPAIASAARPRPAAEGAAESPAPSRRQRPARRRRAREAAAAPPLPSVPSPSPAAARPLRVAPPPPLVLEHGELVARMRKGGVGAPLVENRDGQLSVAGRVTPLSIPVRAGARFVRERGRVRLAVQEFSIRGAPRPDYQALADAKLARLVDVESAAARVVVMKDGRELYAQEVDR